MTKAVDAYQRPHEWIISIRQRPTTATLGDPWEYTLPLLRVFCKKKTQRPIRLRKYRWLVWRRYLGFRRELVCSYFGFCGARDVESQTAEVFIQFRSSDFKFKLRSKARTFILVSRLHIQAHPSCLSLWSHGTLIYKLRLTGVQPIAMRPSRSRLLVMRSNGNMIKTHWRYCYCNRRVGRSFGDVVSTGLQNLPNM